MGVGLREDAYPDDDLVEQGYTKLDPQEPNRVGDRVIYRRDIDRDGKLSADEMRHSGVVYEVDKEGNTTVVAGKWGNGAVHFHHPAQKVAVKNYGDFREYWRPPSSP